MKPLIHISLLAAAFAVVAPFLMLLPVQPSFLGFSEDYPRVDLPIASNRSNRSQCTSSMVVSLTGGGAWVLEGKGVVSETSIPHHLSEYKKRTEDLQVNANLHLRLDASMPAKYLTGIVSAAEQEGFHRFSVATRRN